VNKREARRQGKQDAASGRDPDWKVYDPYLEHDVVRQAYTEAYDSEYRNRRMLRASKEETQMQLEYEIWITEERVRRGKENAFLRRLCPSE
jgi:hypothetical protein